jgi:hypothetical protein
VTESKGAGVARKSLALDYFRMAKAASATRIIATISFKFISLVQTLPEKAAPSLLRTCGSLVAS